MQITSLGLSKKLEKLKLPFKPSHKWCKIYDEWILINIEQEFLYNSNSLIQEGYCCCTNYMDILKQHAAYILDEILEILPDSIEKYELIIDKLSPHYRVHYCYNETHRKNILQEFIHENATEAAGRLLVWCVENGYVGVDRLNEQKEG